MKLKVIVYNSVTSGGASIEAYRIGHLVYVSTGTLTINRQAGGVREVNIFAIEKIQGFSFLRSSAVFIGFDGVDGEYTGYGLVVGTTDMSADDGRYNISMPNARPANTTYRDIRFSMIIPLVDA